MGTTIPCDPQAILNGSLFDEKADTAEPLSSTATLLQPRGEFTAVWFTYEYYDVGPTRQVEELTEILNIGKINGTISPDVTHRLLHFSQAYSRSLEANPLFSEGKGLLCLE